MKKIISMMLLVVAALTASAKTTYVVWQQEPISENQVWINSNYYIWENTYSQTNVDNALEFTPTGKGWIGGGYESVAPFKNEELTGLQLVFDIKTVGKGELSVQLTADKPEAAQSEKLNFKRDGKWHTIRLDVKKVFPKVCKAWNEGAHGYVFSIVGGANDKVYLRNIRYE